MAAAQPGFSPVVGDGPGSGETPGQRKKAAMSRMQLSREIAKDHPPTPASCVVVIGHSKLWICVHDACVVCSGRAVVCRPLTYRGASWTICVVV